jgi:hypothetical protein
LLWRLIMCVPRFSLLAVVFFCSTLFAQNNPLPFLNQPLVPDSAVPGASGFTLTVNGTSFVSGATVNWNGSSRSTTFISSSQLQATILASDVAKPQTAYVTVTNPSPGGGASPAANFQVTVPAPSALLCNEESQSGCICWRGFRVRWGLQRGRQAGPRVLAVGSGSGSATRQWGRNVPKSSGAPSTPVDVNGDGKLDLILTDSLHNAVVIMLGNGDGTFQSPKSFTVGNGTYGPVTGDFNADGNLDIAVVNSSDNTISVLLGNGDGTFRSQIVVSGLGSFPQVLAVGDFNRDGKLDLAVGIFGCRILLDSSWQWGRNVHAWTKFPGCYDLEFRDYSR